MNPQVAFLQWVKANHPQVLAAAVAKVQRKTSLGGLGDDLLSDISFDPDSVSASDSISYANANTNMPTANGADWSGIINSIASAVPQVAGSIVQTQAQLQTIQLNAQRASQNPPLPPLTSQQLMSGQFGSVSTSTILMLGVGLFAVVALMGSRSGGSAPAQPAS